MTDKLFNVGIIINTHGVRGEVKVKRITDFEERFSIGETLYLVLENAPPRPLVIDGHRIHKKMDLIHFKGFNNIEDVIHFKNAYLKIKKEQLTELPDGEFYHHEIIGCDMFTMSGEKVGIIYDILSPGANDVWVVKQAREEDLLIPYIKDVVKQVDVTDKKVIIEPMEGLLD